MEELRDQEVIAGMESGCQVGGGWGKYGTVFYGEGL